MSHAAPDLSLPRELVDAAVAAALAEDLGLAGDITSEATIPAGARASGVIATRKAGVIAGVQLAEAAFKSLDREARVEVLVADGAPRQARRRHRPRLRQRARTARQPSASRSIFSATCPASPR